MFRTATILLASAMLIGLAAGCGSSGSASPGGSSTQHPVTSTASHATTTTASSGVVPLSAEAKSAATGDIPDTQVFLTFTNPAAGYSIAYPEGWTRNGSGTDVAFSNNNNIVHIVITKAGAATPASAAAELNQLKKSSPTLRFRTPTTIQVKSGMAVKVTYTTRSAANPVTGKSVLLIVDRYELSKAGKLATVDLGTPVGVDNVDAYRMMINSFRWR